MKSKNKKSRTSSQKFRRVVTSKPLIISLVALFVLAGLYLVYVSFASSSIPVFNTDPDYWRDRIGYCESGGRYDRIGPSGHTGKYQYDAATWRGAVGPELAAQYPQAYLAPGPIQEQAFNNTFARRGTQPWNASYSCWIKGTTVASPPYDGQSVAAPSQAALPTAPALPANPFGVPSESYNVLVSGRASLNDNPLPNLVLDTCLADQKVTTNADGRFSIAMPLGSIFCLRPVSGVPEGATLEHTNNNVEQAAAKTYEYQKAGVDCYHSIWCLFSPEYNWDRKNDSGYNFYYTKP